MSYSDDYIPHDEGDPRLWGCLVLAGSAIIAVALLGWAAGWWWR